MPAFRTTLIVVATALFLQLPGTTSPGFTRYQSDSTSEHPAPAPALVPLRPLLGTSRYVMLQRAPGDSVYRPFGAVLLTRDSQSIGRLSILRNVARYDWVNGRVTSDTTLSLAATLAPISERTHTPSRIVFYDFHRLRSAGKIGPADSLVAIDDSLPQAAFNSTDLDMLVTALPLKQRFETRLPLYDPEFPGFRMATVRVSGTEKVRSAAGRPQAWILAVDQPSRPTMFYRIEVTTHRMLQKDFGSPAGPAFRVQTAPGR